MSYPRATVIFFLIWLQVLSVKTNMDERLVWETVLRQALMTPEVLDNLADRIADRLISEGIIIP